MRLCPKHARHSLPAGAWAGDTISAIGSRARQGVESWTHHYGVPFETACDNGLVCIEDAGNCSHASDGLNTVFHSAQSERPHLRCYSVIYGRPRAVAGSRGRGKGLRPSGGPVISGRLRRPLRLFRFRSRRMNLLVDMGSRDAGKKLIQFVTIRLTRHVVLAQSKVTLNENALGNPIGEQPDAPWTLYADFHFRVHQQFLGQPVRWRQRDRRRRLTEYSRIRCSGSALHVRSRHLFSAIVVQIAALAPDGLPGFGTCLLRKHQASATGFSPSAAPVSSVKIRRYRSSP